MLECFPLKVKGTSRGFAVSRLDRLCCFDSIAQAQKLVDQFLYGKGFME